MLRIHIALVRCDGQLRCKYSSEGKIWKTAGRIWPKSHRGEMIGKRFLVSGRIGLNDQCKINSLRRRFHLRCAVIRKLQSSSTIQRKSLRICILVFSLLFNESTADASASSSPLGRPHDWHVGTVLIMPILQISHARRQALWASG